jgi:hypothetical protein
MAWELAEVFHLMGRFYRKLTGGGGGPNPTIRVGVCLGKDECWEFVELKQSQKDCLWE